MKKSSELTYRELFANNLRRSRRAKDISQEDLALSSGMSRSYGLPETLQMVGWESYLTIGTVEFGETPQNNIIFDDDLILSSIKSKSVDDFLPPNFHVWATLPSMEIVDNSILPFLWEKGFLTEKPKNFFVAENPDEIKNLKYTPILIGGEFLKKTNLVISS
ncbi:MAG: hypothetical protein NVSMB70_17540 [Chamaesiphon sp.]